MRVAVGQPVTATIAAPPGVTTLGARIEVPGTRAIVACWQTATLQGDQWTVTVDGPLKSGDYQLVWRTPDPEPPDFETFVPITASYGGAG